MYGDIILKKFERACIKQSFRDSIRIDRSNDRKIKSRKGYSIMKKRFFLVAFLLAVTFVACCSLALADDNVPPPELISENLTFSSVDWHRSVMTISDELEIVRMTASISKSDSTHVAIRAVTAVNKTCGMVGGQAVVQQWKNNKWNTYHTTTYTAFTTTEASVENIVAVESGYYYRLAIDHFAQHVSESASGFNSTKSILVN